MFCNNLPRFDMFGLDGVGGKGVCINLVGAYAVVLYLLGINLPCVYLFAVIGPTLLQVAG